MPIAGPVIACESDKWLCGGFQQVVELKSECCERLFKQAFVIQRAEQTPTYQATCLKVTEKSRVEVSLVSVE